MFLPEPPPFLDLRQKREEGGFFSGIAMMKWYLILDTRFIDDDDSITMMMALHAHPDSVFKAVHESKSLQARLDLNCSRLEIYFT